MNKREMFGRELTPEMLLALDFGEVTRRAKREQSRAFWSMIQGLFANRRSERKDSAAAMLAPQVKAC